MCLKFNVDTSNTLLFVDGLMEEKLAFNLYLSLLSFSVCYWRGRWHVNDSVRCKIRGVASPWLQIRGKSIVLRMMAIKWQR